MAHKIYLSPSDQRSNTYAVGGTNEAEQCRKIALATVEALKRCGLEARTNTTWNGDEAMEYRVEQSNDWGADLHIPIHTNAYNGSVMGTRMFCFSSTGAGYEACKAIMAALAPITPGNSDSITVRDLYEVRAANAPTAYLEVGFHDNPVEAQWIISNTAAIAEAVCKGVCDYVGATYLFPGDIPAPDPAPAPEPAGKLYRVQVGAFRAKDNAEAYRDKLRADGYDAFIVEV